MPYRVQVAPAAVWPLRELDPSARRRIQAAFELLAEQPRPSGPKKLVGGDGEWRVRTGDYRIVYEIPHDALLILVVAVGHRREVTPPRQGRTFPTKREVVLVGEGAPQEQPTPPCCPRSQRGQVIW